MKALCAHFAVPCPIDLLAGVGYHKADDTIMIAKSP
jgi:hypothetical protein